MSLDQPAPPDPMQTANAQAGFNKQAAIDTAQLNNVNQINPYGSLTYKKIGVNADGTPRYQAVTQLSPEQQALLDTQQKNQGLAGTQAGILTGQIGDQLSKGMDTDQSAIVKQLMGWQSDYMAPTFKQQQSNLDSKLNAQGITQGSEAYTNAQRDLNQSQTLSMENAMAGDQAQAYNQAVTNYTTPLQAELGSYQSFYGNSTPGSVTANLVNTPSVQIQPADYSGVAEQNYQQQNANYENTLSGLFGVPSALLGGWARGGGMTGLFGGK